MDELIDFLNQEDVKQFIKQNVDADPNQLVLNPPQAFQGKIKEIASQILARQKAKRKLGDWANNFDLIMPPPLSIEQASSKLTCEYKKHLISGKQLIDLTGGMGIDFLALAGSFSQSTYVEREPLLCNVFRHNARVLGSQVTVKNVEASEYLNTLDTIPNETVIYLDPARRNQQKSRVFKIEDCSPNLLNLMPLLEQKAGRVLIKYSPMLDIQAILKFIPHVKEIHVVSVKNDCKEVLILLDFRFTGDAQIHCVNLETEQPLYSFQIVDENSIVTEFQDVDAYLFEPNSSIMKAGAFKKIASDFKIGKLSENTHFCTSSGPIQNFPGRIFKVMAKADELNLKQFAPNGKINVITRNYPLSSTELKKKWRLKDGGNYYLMAFRDKKGKAQTVIAERLDLLK